MSLAARIFRKKDVFVNVGKSTSRLFLAYCKNPFIAVTPIRPIVFGGSGDEQSLGCAKRVRRFVRLRLKQAEFGYPQVKWCPRNDCQDAIVHLPSNIIEVVMKPIPSNALQGSASIHR